MSLFLTRRRLRGGLTGLAVAAMVLTTAACGGTTAVIATSTRRGRTTTGMPVPPMELIAHVVQDRGKSATAWSPRTTNARPR